jgi:hypothetical protein
VQPNVLAGSFENLINEVQNALYQHVGHIPDPRALFCFGAAEPTWRSIARSGGEVGPPMQRPFKAVVQNLISIGKQSLEYRLQVPGQMGL